MLSVYRMSVFTAVATKVATTLQKTDKKRIPKQALYKPKRRRNMECLRKRPTSPEDLTLRLLMSYRCIYGAPILDVSRSHTTTQHVGGTPLD